LDLVDGVSFCRRSGADVSPFWSLSDVMVMKQRVAKKLGKSSASNEPKI
jgi:hypothetical protein